MTQSKKQREKNRKKNEQTQALILVIPIYMLLQSQKTEIRRKLTWWNKGWNFPKFGQEH